MFCVDFRTSTPPNRFFASEYTWYMWNDSDCDAVSEVGKRNGEKMGQKRQARAMNVPDTTGTENAPTVSKRLLFCELWHKEFKANRNDELQ